VRRDPSDLGSRLRACWSTRDPRHFHLRDGATDAEIAAFERTHLVRLPEDLTGYLAAVDGMEPDETDEEVTSFWGLDRIRPAVEVYPRDVACRSLSDARRYFVLCDVLIDSFWYAIRLGPRPGEPNPVVQWGCEVNRPVAASFTEFAEAYLADPTVLPVGLKALHGPYVTE
jgi:hypothetical protein